MQPILADKAFPELVQWADELAALRRDIHAHPELGFETPRTVDLIVKTLKGWGLEHVDPDEVKGGVVVVINGAAPGATVALRADIDALPMPDNSVKRHLFQLTSLYRLLKTLWLQSTTICMTVLLKTLRNPSSSISASCSTVT